MLGDRLGSKCRLSLCGLNLLELIVEGIMNRKYLVAITFLGITACATSEPGPQSPSPDPQVEPTRTTSAATTARNSTARNTPAVKGEHEGDNVPEVNVVASGPENTVICHRQKRTGSNIVERICRTQASIERRRREDREEFQRLRNRNRDGGSNNE